MQKAIKHPKEEERLEVLRSKKIDYKENDPRFDSITKKAVGLLSVPISTVTFIEEEKELYKSCIGLDKLEGPREISFCGHAVLNNNVLICEDTLEDERFKDNPYVVGEPYIRFYAGIRLLDRKSGLPIGVFCVKDTKPRSFTTDELQRFLELGSEAEELIQ